MKVEFYKHNISEEDIANVNKVLRSLFLSTGDTVKEFEEKFSNYMVCKHTIGVTSCTAALHLSLLALGIKKGDEIITTPMSFIATANVIEYTEATPVFVDIEPSTGNIDANKIEAAITSKTKAIIPVHLYGQMCDMFTIADIAYEHSLFIIEDAAHAIESKRTYIKPSWIGHSACFSFYATKTVTCGEGGAVCTDDDQLADKLRKLRLHGMSKNAADRYTKKYEHYDMEMLGYKYNMSNIQAALLLNQIDNLEKYWQRREQICKMYEEAFKDNENIKYMSVLPDSKNARYAFTILVDPLKRDSIMWKLQDKGIGIAVNFRAIHLLKYYREKYGYKPGLYPIAEDIGNSTITLPLYPKLTDDEVQYVIEKVKEAVK